MKKKSDKPPAPAPSAADLYVARGEDRFRESEFELAREYFGEAVRVAPGDPRGWRGRGRMWQYLREPANALSDYNEALRLDPAHSETFLNRGTVHFWRGEYDLALKDYGDALRLDAKSVDAFRYRALARAKKDDHAGAVRDLTEALALAPGSPSIYLSRALARIKTGEPESALPDLDKAIELDPRSTEALEKRSEILRGRGDAKSADEDAARAKDVHQQRSAVRGPQTRTLIPSLLGDHFRPTSLDDLLLTERIFPFRVRADLQRATEALFQGKTKVCHFSGVRQSYSHEGMEFTGLIAARDNDPPVAVPAEYEEIDIGEELPVRCPKSGLWLLEEGDQKFAVFLSVAQRYGQTTGLKFEVAALNTKEGSRVTQEFFKHLEDSVLRSESYRGKVLSLEDGDRFTGRSTGFQVHKLRSVSREQVILPRKTIDLLDRNVVGFSERRHLLGKFGLSTKKGILFYGPPGTGKTHTIHYLIGALKGHTTFLITAGQMGLLSEYMTLARLLQPSIVVIEDVDLIARDRMQQDGVCSETLLNLLLNEMDGLKPDTDVFFILTTNRPESLEAALSSRPGRIDQAIEYPLPDDESREKLVRLYSQGLSLSSELIGRTVTRTRGVSASFIRELMRRSAQFHLERGATSGELVDADVDSALDELLVSGGRLNRKLLGAPD